ncbi:MAG: tetratricopeptide repeat protein [Anaerolineaceae bacterium]|nr:tetratricopeptide repeat protein [Anaerolineaceae bacterium]
MLTDTITPKTRITIPRRRGDLISRQRLLDLLNELLEKKLVLLSAPAGYGKTSLLLDFASAAELPICWYTITALDNEPQRFISNLIAAINLRFPEFGNRTKAAFQNSSSNMDVNSIAITMVNDLYENISEHFVIVLDDFHLVNDNSRISNFVSQFIQDVDENCHLIITSRTLLSLPFLPMMVARSEVGGLSFEELAFRIDEIQQLFLQNQNRILTHEEAGRIFDKTEGWATGIVLTAQTDPQSAASRARLLRVSGVGLDDYFLQLLKQQPDDLQVFLLRTSLLEEFNADRCKMVIEKSLKIPPLNWSSLMEKVQHNNLFVLPVGEDGSWLRYNYLFLDFLQSRMLREHPDEVPIIERALAQLYAENEDWDHAFTIYRRLDSMEDQITLVEKAGPKVLADGRVSTLSAWLDTLPSNILSSRPFLIALQGGIAATTGDSNLALTLYDQAIDAMTLLEDRRSMARALGWRAVTHRIMGNLKASLGDAQETLDLVQKDIEMRVVKAEALRNIGICLRLQGKLNEALTWLIQSLNTSMSIHDRKNEAIIRLELGLLYENLGDYAPAREMYLAALEYWETVNNTSWLSNIMNNLGVLQHLMGDYRAAMDIFERALGYARTSNSRLEAFILTGIGDIYGELEAVEEAEKAYQQAKLITQSIEENFLQVYIHVQNAALLSSTGDHRSAYRLLEEARRIANLDGQALEAYLCDLEQAGIKLREGKWQEAIPILEEASYFFEGEGHKVQVEKASLYLTIAYSQGQNQEKLLEHLIRLLSFLASDHPPVSLIAATYRFQDHLSQLRKLDYIQTQIDELFLKISAFEDQLPVLRRYVRQRAVAVPFAPPKIYIRTLGKMQVKIDDQLVTSSNWQTQAARDLFFLLLTHPEGMTKEEIGAIFWPDAPPEDVKFRIKNTIYRLRHAVGKDIILLDQDSYRFNNLVDYEYDVEVFLRENALAQQGKERLHKLSHFREATKLYKGEFLPDIYETWVHSPRESLQQIYLNILLQVADIYIESSNFDLALDYVQRAIKEDNCLETAYRMSFKIYAAMGNRAAMVRQYQRCVEILQREINAEPSPQTQALYNELLK